MLYFFVQTSSLSFATLNEMVLYQHIAEICPYVKVGHDYSKSYGAYEGKHPTTLTTVKNSTEMKVNDS